MNYIDILRWGNNWYQNLTFRLRDNPMDVGEFSDQKDISRYHPNIQVQVAHDISHDIQQWVKAQFLEYSNLELSVLKMEPGKILPYHSDAYEFYRQTHKISNINDIRRVIVFLQDWQPGHVSEINGQPNVNWTAGNWIKWIGNTPHLAANIGHTSRYTLQLTGMCL
jgi:hypothetical protein